LPWNVEIVLDQYDGLGVGEVAIGQFFQDVSVVHGGMAIGDLDVAPAFERANIMKMLRAVALVLVIAAGRASPLHRDRQGASRQGTAGGLVQATPAGNRRIAVAARVDRQHIFHGGYERATGLFGGMTQHCLAMRAGEMFFFSARPIVESLA